MLKIEVKLQIIPPNAQQRSAPLLMTQSENLPLSKTPLSTIAYSSNQYENTSIKLSLNLSTISRPVGRAVMHLFLAGSQGFKSRAGQVGHSVGNGSPPLQRFFERNCVATAQ